jgi:hypothetical protein
MGNWPGQIGRSKLRDRFEYARGDLLRVHFESARGDLLRVHFESARGDFHPATLAWDARCAELGLRWGLVKKSHNLLSFAQ